MAKINYKKQTLKEPDFAGSEKLSGQDYGRLRTGGMDYYRLTKNSSDYKKYVMEYVKGNPTWAGKADTIAKNADGRFNCTLGGLCRMLTKGMADTHQEYNTYWESLPGTMGTPKPLTFFVNDQLKMLLESGEVIAEVKKEKEEKANVHKPSIQERIFEQTVIMTEFIEQALDDFSNKKITDFKAIKLLSHLRQLQCKQPHARLIKTWYEPQIKEYHEVMNPPNTKNMTEEEKDWANQLKEGYSHHDKRSIKKVYDFLVSVVVACDGIIAESKANRKPRKISAKSPEKVVEKLKYKIADEKYGSSIEAHKFIMANMLVVFNCKNRKLGVYYTSNEDPMGQKRDGTGLYLKGQTIQRFDDKKSVWKVLRKPNEQLEEFRKLNTRRKFENWYSQIKTTETVMNGRINPETMLVGVY